MLDVSLCYIMLLSTAASLSKNTETMTPTLMRVCPLNETLLLTKGLSDAMIVSLSTLAINQPHYTSVMPVL